MGIPALQQGWLALLKQKDVRLLWLAHLLSLMLLNASSYATLVLLEGSTRSTTLLGLALLTFCLPAFLLAAPAGALVDRVKKRRLLCSCHGLWALTSLGMALALLLTEHSLLPLYLLLFVSSSIGQCYTPAEGSLLPALVSHDALPRALALFQGAVMLAQAVGFFLLAPLFLLLIPPLTLWMLRVAPVELLFLLIALLYGVCALLTRLLSPPRPSATGPGAGQPSAPSSPAVRISLWRDVKQGWHFLRGAPALRVAVSQLSVAGILLLVVAELATPLLTQVLQLPLATLPLVFSPAGVALVAGSVIIPKVIERCGKARTIVLGSLTFALALALVLVSSMVAPWLHPHGWKTHPVFLGLIGVSMFGAGVALNCMNLPAQLALQEQSPAWIKGRLLAWQFLLYNIAALPVILFTGALTDLLGIQAVLALLVGGVVLFGVWSAWANQTPVLHQGARGRSPAAVSRSQLAGEQPPGEDILVEPATPQRASPPS